MTYKEALYRALNTSCSNCQIECESECDICREAVDLVDGLITKANKYVWHDLRKDPTDLPDDDRLVDCRTTDKQSAYYGNYIKDTFTNGESINRWIDTEGFTMQVVAWRDIEPFEEDMVENKLKTYVAKAIKDIEAERVDDVLINLANDILKEDK